MHYMEPQAISSYTNTPLSSLKRGIHAAQGFVSFSFTRVHKYCKGNEIIISFLKKESPQNSFIIIYTKNFEAERRRNEGAY